MNGASNYDDDLPIILELEIVNIIKKLKKGKTLGIDGVTNEIIKYSINIIKNNNIKIDIE